MDAPTLAMLVEAYIQNTQIYTILIKHQIIDTLHLLMTSL
jgi:hypothetical protein